ncbi:Uma2 family endonuclease [Leptolyngbya sp. DQ-M1]|uniref:Uma2 family endonuclease n=1 Tax=Leptolyngbya sp. DQ-M1 TaxID=2933920 RepID=UPI0032981DCC
MQTQTTASTAQSRIISIPDRTWNQFKLLQQAFEVSHAKLTYFANTIEIFMPSEPHDLFSRIILFLMGHYCLERRVQFIPTGSADREREGIVSLQPDESFYVGRKAIPDLAIEVVFTSGNESKLPRYQVLEIPEVWFWEDGVFALYRLFEGNYRKIQRSEIPGLQDLNIQLLSRCILTAETDMLGAIDELRKAI